MWVAAVALLVVGVAWSSEVEVEVDGFERKLRRDLSLVELPASDDVLDSNSVLRASVGWDGGKLGLGTASADPNVGGRAFVFGWSGKSWDLRRVLSPERGVNAGFGSAVSVRGAWTFVGGHNLQGVGGELHVLLEDRTVKTVWEPHDRFGQSASCGGRTLVVSSADRLTFYELSEQFQWDRGVELTLASARGLPPPRNDPGLDMRSISRFADVRLEGEVGIVACRSAVRVLAAVFQRDGSSWSFRELVGLPEIVTFPPAAEGLARDPQPDAPAEGEEEFEASVDLDAERMVVGCKTCQFRHSVRVVEVTAGKSALGSELLTLQDDYPYRLLWRRFGVSVGLGGELLAVSDLPNQYIYLLQRPEGGQWTLVHQLFKPEVLQLTTFGEDLTVRRGHVLTAGAAARFRYESPLLYYNATKRRVPSDEVPDIDRGDGTDKVDGVQKAPITARTTTALVLLSSSCALMCAKVVLILRRMISSVEIPVIGAKKPRAA